MAPHLAALRAYAERLRAEGPARRPDAVPRVPLASYGAVPRVAGGPVPAEAEWPAEWRPGPQPENAGLTPGWPPEPPPPPEVAAAVGELAAATRTAERVGAAARKADKRGWEVAQWVADLERQLEIMGRELETLRAESAAHREERDAGHRAGGRGGAGGGTPPPAAGAEGGRRAG